MLAGEEDVPDAAWNVSASGKVRAPGFAMVEVMLWMVVAAAALPKMSPHSPVARCSLSSVSWCEQKVVLHAAHALLARGGAVPVGLLLGEADHGKERASGNGDEPFIVNL